MIVGGFSIQLLVKSVLQNMTSCNKSNNLFLILAKDEIAGPVFEHEPPDHVDFSSLSGTTIPCSAKGNPRPSIKWLQADSNTVANNGRFRRIANNGSLTFLSFQSEDYRPDVHATVYRCIATNSVGTIVSREVHIKAGKSITHLNGNQIVRNDKA